MTTAVLEPAAVRGALYPMRKRGPEARAGDLAGEAAACLACPIDARGRDCASKPMNDCPRVQPAQARPAQAHIYGNAQDTLFHGRQEDRRRSSTAIPAHRAIWNGCA
jgi:hypothetical protein